MVVNQLVRSAERDDGVRECLLLGLPYSHLDQTVLVRVDVERLIAEGEGAGLDQLANGHRLGAEAAMQWR